MSLSPLPFKSRSPGRQSAAVQAACIDLSGTDAGPSQTSDTRLIRLAATGCVLAVLALTMGRFVPASTAFAAKAIPVDQVSGKLGSWLMIHNFRLALATAASASGLWAVSK